MISRALASLSLCLCLMLPAAEGAEVSDISGLLRDAAAAFNKGNSAETIALTSKILETERKDDRPYFLRGRAYEATRQDAKAVADYDAGLKLNPTAGPGYQYRGVVRFRMGQIKESIADFDRFIELVPAQAPYHWQRGLALYYAGRFEDGRKQLELHQTVNPSDVENAVWHFLCVARTDGLEKARASLIPIERDARVPMMEIHALFAGKATPEDVLTAAKAGHPAPAALDNQLFYAHLYLGLYFEAAGNAKLAREHIFKAATDFKAEHYMGDVARVHARLLRQSAK